MEVISKERETVAVGIAGMQGGNTMKRKTLLASAGAAAAASTFRAPAIAQGIRELKQILIGDNL